LGQDDTDLDDFPDFFTGLKKISEEQGGYIHIILR
jgi:hypothetical protein